MEVNRRQFLKISAGAIGTVVATEMEGWGVDTVALKKEALNIPIKTGQQVPSVGCGQIMINHAGKILDIQGNPDSPISFGHVSARCKRPSLDKGKIPGGDN